MQVYRGLDLGTAKASLAERQRGELVEECELVHMYAAGSQRNPHPRPRRGIMVRLEVGGPRWDVANEAKYGIHATISSLAKGLYDGVRYLPRSPMK